MKLYSGPLSLFTGKVRIALDEKGVAYERVDVPFSRAQGYTPKHPDVLALNPKAQVPVLVDGELAIYDSTLIFEYLEERYPEPPLFPSDVAARARCRQAEAASDEIFFPNVWTLIHEAFYKPRESDRDHDLDTRLARNAYVCSEQFTVADIAYFMTISFATGLGAAPDASLSHLAAWSARVSERPSIQREMQRLATASTAA